MVQAPHSTQEEPSVIRSSLLYSLLVVGALASGRIDAATHPATMPAFTLPTRDGTVAGDSLRGHVVLVDFWASWCVPCRQSFPWLETMHERYSAKGLRIIAMNVDKTREAATEFLAHYPATFTVAFDPKGATAEAFHVKGMPSSFLVAPDGTVLHASTGFDAKTGKNLEALIQKACTP
jgi:thiol-disulfide isomerase/thioredoxin